jgi:hypothetical protein
MPGAIVSEKTSLLSAMSSSSDDSLEDSLAPSALQDRIMGQGPAPETASERAQGVLSKARSLMADPQLNDLAAKLTEALKATASVEDSAIGGAMRAPLAGKSEQIAHYVVKIVEQSVVLESKIKAGDPKAIEAQRKYVEKQLGKLASTVKATDAAIAASLNAATKLIGAWRKKNQDRLFSQVHPKAATAVQVIGTAASVVGVVGNVVGTAVGMPGIGTLAKTALQGVSAVIEYGAKASDDAETMSQYEPLLTPESGPSSIATGVSVGAAVLGKGLGALGVDEEIVSGVGKAASVAKPLAKKLDDHRDASAKRVDLTGAVSALESL